MSADDPTHYSATVPAKSKRSCRRRQLRNAVRSAAGGFAKARRGYDHLCDGVRCHTTVSCRANMQTANRFFVIIYFTEKVYKKQAVTPQNPLKTVLFQNSCKKRSKLNSRYVTVSQLVEQPIRNRHAAGSSPACSTKKALFHSETGLFHVYTFLHFLHRDTECKSK